MQSTVACAKRLYGTDEPPASYRALKAGPLSARLEDGNLRAIRFAGRECLRAVSYIIRDKDWGTYRPPLRNLFIEESETSFRVTYEGSCESPHSTLRFRAEIIGEAAGRLSFTVEATPDGAFETNRCGFNVLHPLEAAGRPVTVEHTGGSVEETVFPELIEPWQPFKDIRALTYRPGGLFDANCRFEGDVFEMEDQRNWSDASFKTYVRPIELPWPYELPAGETNRQSVVLDISGHDALKASNNSSKRLTASLRITGRASAAMPAIGVVIMPEEVDAALSAIDRLRELKPQTVLCHFDPTAGHGGGAFRKFAALQEKYPADYSLECVVAATGDLNGELRQVAQHVEAAGLKLSSIAVCPSVDRQSTPPGSKWPDCPPLADIYAAARSAFPGVSLGGGMFSYFTELNRKRPPVELLDFVTHATNPIVHAADDESVMETISALPHITRSTRAIIGETKSYRIGPSTIGMRQNPYGSRTMPNPDRKRVPMAAEDPRQDGLFAAAWTVGYAAAVAPAGLELLTPAAFSGPRGLITGDTVRPVFHAMKWLAAGAGAETVIVENDDPALAVLATRREERLTLLIANLSDDVRDASVEGTGRSATIEMLDADHPEPREQAYSGILRLDAFAIARVRL
ncbi:MAG: D-apionate lactonase [Rhizobiaceae bacterium]